MRVLEDICNYLIATSPGSLTPELIESLTKDGLVRKEVFRTELLESLVMKAYDTLYADACGLFDLTDDDKYLVSEIVRLLKQPAGKCWLKKEQEVLNSTYDALLEELGCLEEVLNKILILKGIVDFLKGGVQ